MTRSSVSKGILAMLSELDTSYSAPNATVKESTEYLPTGARAARRQRLAESRTAGKARPRQQSRALRQRIAESVERVTTRTRSGARSLKESRASMSPEEVLALIEGSDLLDKAQMDEIAALIIESPEHARYLVRRMRKFPRHREKLVGRIAKALARSKTLMAAFKVLPSLESLDADGYPDIAISGAYSITYEQPNITRIDVDDDVWDRVDERFYTVDFVLMLAGNDNMEPRALIRIGENTDYANAGDIDTTSEPMDIVCDSLCELDILKAVRELRGIIQGTQEDMDDAMRDEMSLGRRVDSVSSQRGWR